MSEDRTERESEREAGGTAPRGRVRRWVLAYLLFAFAGLVASGIAWRTHWLIRTSPPDFTPSCKISETVDCTKTATSDWAVFLHVPVALWSALAFGVMLTLAALGLRRREGDTFPAGLLFWLGAAACGVSILLALVSRLVLHVLCIECTVMQSLSLFVFLTGWMQLRDLRTGPFAALGADLRFLAARRALSWTLAIAAVAVTGALVGLYPDHRAPSRPVPTVGLSGPGGVATGLTDRGNPYIGAEDPAVAVMEFTDYQCPHCHEAHRILRELVAKHPDRIRLVHFHLPLDNACNPAVPRPFHRYACALAEAAACAAEQGRFWEMNDAIIRWTERSGAPDMQALMREAGIDAEALRACVAEGRGRERVDGDLQASAIFEGAGLELGTPAFVILERSGQRRLFVGLGGEHGVLDDVLRRLEAGWPEEPGPETPAGRSQER